MSDTDVAISVRGVSKNFRLPQEKHGTVKSLFTNILRGRNRVVKTQHALKDISFEIKKGEFFGIVGRNGSGKSTMLKMLAGIYQPTKGTVQVHGKLVPFIELGVGFNPELTGRENVYLNGALLGFDKKQIDSMYKEIVEFAELERFMDQKLKNYSSGMQVRLAFSMAVQAKADILLVDEVLAVGDADFQRKCFEYFKQLKKNKKTVVFVSHNMAAIREYCDRAVLIEDSEMICEADANEVSGAYTRMFIEQNSDAKQDKSTTNSMRWGDGVASYLGVEVSKTIFNDDDEEIIIQTVAVAAHLVENPIFGFSIKNSSGEQVLGTNSQIRRNDVKNMTPDEQITVTWRIPNVFAEGDHYIDLAIVYADGTATADWWEEAKTFKVVREERTPYVISPHIKLEVTTKG